MYRITNVGRERTEKRGADRGEDGLSWRREEETQEETPQAISRCYGVSCLEGGFLMQKGRGLIRSQTTESTLHLGQCPITSVHAHVVTPIRRVP